MEWSLFWTIVFQLLIFIGIFTLPVAFIVFVFASARKAGTSNSGSTRLL